MSKDCVKLGPRKRKIQLLMLEYLMAASSSIVISMKMPTKAVHTPMAQKMNQRARALRVMNG